MPLINTAYEGGQIFFHLGESPEEFMALPDRGFVVTGRMATHQVMGMRLDEFINFLQESTTTEDKAYAQFVTDAKARGEAREVTINGTQLTIVPLQKPIDLATLLTANLTLSDSLAIAPDDAAIAAAHDHFSASGCNMPEHEFAISRLRESPLFEAMSHYLNQQLPSHQPRPNGPSAPGAHL